MTNNVTVAINLFYSNTKVCRCVKKSKDKNGEEQVNY